jgi:hypothetical protein
VRRALELVHDAPLGLELGTALPAPAHVRAKGGDAEPQLTVEQQVEFVWK